MIDLFKENIIASFDKTPIIYPQDSYQIAFSHEGADFYVVLRQEKVPVKLRFIY